MTRGTFVLLTDKTVFGSCEFNGDMYYDGGHGVEVVERLKKVKNYEDFVNEVKAFDLATFMYQNDEGEYFSVDDYKIPPYGINFNKTYFNDWWFSDYLYILNLSSKSQIIKDRDGLDLVIEPNEIQIYRFGHFEGTSFNTYKNGRVKLMSDRENWDVNEEDEDIDEKPMLNEVTISSFTVDSNELTRMYKAGYIKGPSPTTKEVYDALHDLLGRL